MNEQLIDKAVGFLITMRSGDRFESVSQRDEAYRKEICAALQVRAALRMAGMPGRPLPDDMLVQCTGCKWAGPAEQLHDGPLGKIYCPACNGSSPERIA